MRGISVSKGIAVAKPFIFKRQEILINDLKIPLEDVISEKNKIQNAIKKAEMQLEILKEKALKEIGEEEADIFEAHLTMLKDPMLVDDINNNIEKRKKAEVAIELARLKIEQMFKAIPDAYIQARAADVNDVTRRLIRMIKKVVEDAHDHNKIVGMCGEMAGDPLHSAVLVGLGLDELSMSASSIPKVKEMIRRLRYEETRDLANRLINCKTVLEIKEILEKESVVC